MKRPKTYLTKTADATSSWQVIDATGEVLGRLAVNIARTLQGKDKPTYTPHVLSGDHVIVLNVDKVRVTGRKLTQKTYYRHSGYTGNLKTMSLRDMMKDHPDRVLKLAVKGMLPATKLGKLMLGRLRVYSGDVHPHEGQTSQMTEER